jgi:glycosyltransferase involved in cell wall biosynthesis
MKAAAPIVAVIIPTYNRWPLVVRAVESVLSQSYPGTQCVVVDDASTDGTPEKLRERFQDRVMVIQQPRNQEKSAARNAGVRTVNADYICFLDSDDELTKDSVQSRMEIFLRDRSFDGVAYGFSEGAGKPEELQALFQAPPEGDVLATYLRQQFVNNNGFMLSRPAMLQHGMYQETLTHREDRELLIRLALRCEFRSSRTVVTQVHRTAGSARFEYDKANAQGLEMIRVLRANAEVVQRLGHHLRGIEQAEHWEWLRGLYKSGYYRAFRENLSTSWNIFDGKSRRALARRWLSSFWRQVTRGDSASVSRANGAPAQNSRFQRVAAEKSTGT